VADDGGDDDDDDDQIMKVWTGTLRGIGRNKNIYTANSFMVIT
jgi:hypothetical protein